MTDAITTWAEVLGLASLALGFSWLAFDYLGTAWALMTFGAVILSMSASLAALASRRKGGDV